MTNTATRTMAENLRLDKRRLRATSIASAIIKEISPFLRDEDGRERRDAYDRIFELLHQQGIEVLSDYDREQLGLGKRDSDGWTEAELRALDDLRLLTMLKPITMKL